jgi:hypothetical protein
MLAIPASAGDSEMYVGRLVDQGSIPGRSTTYITLNIESITPDDTVVQLANVLAESGQDAVISAMWDMDSAGWIKIGTSLGYQVQIIRSLPTEDGGRIIRVVTDRPIMFYESMRGTRSKQYPFGLLELRLGPDGKGEGTMIAAAQLSFSKEGRLEIKSYGTQPFKIVQIALSK